MRRRRTRCQLALVAVFGITAAGCAGDDSAAADESMSEPADDAMVVRCDQPTEPISPLIYGIGFRGWEDQSPPDQWEVGASSRRWGGNPTSRYNWESGHFWNTANDYYFLNISILQGEQPAHEQFLQASADNQMASLVTIPMLGWVAKDDTSYGFPVSQFGSQQSTEYSITDAGDGRTPDGEEITPGPPEQTSIASTPDDAGAWVAAMAEFAERQGIDAPAIYFLDNEPDLWHYTHRDVRAEPITYDELLSLGIAYGEAIQSADPDALIAGPSPWGWPTYTSSAADLEDNQPGGPDAESRGNVPILQWYLEQMRTHEESTGERLLDLLDIHFYPQGERIFMGGGSDADDPDLARRRVRSTRALWDPGYVDESWIDEPVRLVPRMQELIDTTYPGTGLSIGEYNFGGETEISGGVAQALALGTFGRLGVDNASLWTYPPYESPAYWAFRAFRNFDGDGGAFAANAVPVTEPTVATSVFASANDAGDEHVLVVVNTSTVASSITLDVATCASFEAGVELFSDAGTGAGQRPQVAPELANGSITLTLEPWSISVLRSGQR